MNQLPPWINWGLALPLIVLNAWVLLQIFQYFQPLINVFVTAMLLAFVLDYPVQALRHLRVKRTQAIFLVLLLTLTTLIIVGVTLIPALIVQVNELAKEMPNWITSSSQQLQIIQTWAKVRRFPIDLSRLILQLEEQFSSQLQALSGEIFGFLFGAIGRIFELVLTFVLTFYILLHGDRLWAGIFRWFPPHSGKKIRRALRQNFHNYFAGQATLALLMGSAMTVAFLLIQVPFGLLFGLAIGVMTLIPFGAGFSICIVSLLMTLQSVWLGAKVLVVATVIDQIIESLVAPQLIGGFTGLNPVWILAALLIGAKIGGFLGVLVAVPLASSIKGIAEALRSPNKSSKENSSVTDIELF
jgi:predicted PurR-regulated permease PerM